MTQAFVKDRATAAQIAARVRSLELGEAAAAVAWPRRLIPGAAGFVGLSLLCACAMMLAGALSAHDCRVRPIPLTLGSDADISIAVPGRTPCTILVRAGDAVLDEVAITAPPGRGTLAARGRTGVTYRPSPGFKGDDSFAFSLRGRSSAVTGTSTIRVRARIG
jgi:hypothetical protein